MSATIEQLLTGQSFEQETWDGLDLGSADLSKKEFVDCTFRSLKLAQCRWNAVRLEDCVFEDCDLTRLSPVQLTLRGVEFRRCKLLGFDWSKVSEHPDMSFVDCNLSYATFVSLTAHKTRFTRCVLVEASFERSELVAAVFDECQLAGARFDSCNLERASFAGCRDLLLDPARNKLRGASIPLDAAVALAGSFGLQVVGFSKASQR
ncbi:MAG TPA: pentapeptide repeat-containing protein [Polyangiales bacterium]